jgi:hypothetical protein
MRAGRRPAPDDEVAFADDHVDRDPEVGEGGPEVVGDLFLVHRAGDGIS